MEQFGSHAGNELDESTSELFVVPDAETGRRYEESFCFPPFFGIFRSMPQPEESTVAALRKKCLERRQHEFVSL